LIVSLIHAEWQVGYPSRNLYFWVFHDPSVKFHWKRL